MTTSTPSPSPDSAALTQHVSVRGIDVAYSDAGVGPVVLSAPGLSSSRRANRALGLADFAEVAATGHRLISYDARGHGETTGSAAEADYTWSALADDLLALADHFAPGEQVSGIGSSMGTGTLLHAAVRRPETFDRLVLTAPPTAWETRAGQAGMYRVMADTVEAADPSVLAGLFAQAPVPPIFAGLPGYPPAPDIRPGLMPTVFRGAGLTDLPPLESIAALTQPTMIIAWAGDPGHPVSTAERLHEAIDGSVLHVSESQSDLFTWGQRAAEFLAG